MTDRLNFEARLEERLRARAAFASRPFDAAAIARQAVVVEGRRRQIGRLAWPSTRPALRWLVLALLLALAVLGAVAGIGALLRERPPLPSGASNGWIVVSANPKTIGGGEFGDLYLVGEGDAARRIIGADGDGIAQACPRFSPDGHRLAYGEARVSEVVTNFRDDWPVRDRAVVVVGLNDSGEASEPIVRVAMNAPAGAIPCPEWSPDGMYVAFRNGAELWVADTVSGQTTEFPVFARALPEEGAELVPPETARNLSHDFAGFAWSRDGSHIAVPEPGQLRVINVDDGSSNLIPVDGWSRSIGWMANDSGIVYMTTDENRDGVSVRVVNADGTNDTQISPDPAGLRVRFPEFVVSPDGRRVALIQKTYRCGMDECRSDPLRLLIAEPDRRSMVELPIAMEFASTLRWSPDGERLLFMTYSEVEVGWKVVSVALEPGSPAIVHSINELNLEWSDSEVTWQPVFP
jgi:dipeptidyl aminopeptidase/acylaminoacyl peptidase